MTIINPFYPMSTKKRIDALKSLWGKSIHGERSLTEDRSYNVKLVPVDGGYRKKQGLLRFPLMANRSEVLMKSKWG